MIATQSEVKVQWTLQLEEKTENRLSAEAEVPLMEHVEWC